MLIPRKLKIGIFIDNYYPTIDGVVVVVDNYAKELSKIAEVVVIAPSYGYKNDKKNNSLYRIIRIKSIKVPIINYQFAIPEIDIKCKNKLIKENFDIIHIHSPFNIGKLGLSIAKSCNIPVVATMHSQFKKDFLRWTKSEKISDILTSVIMNVYNNCDECWAVNQKIANLFQEYGYKGQPIVMNNATEFETIKDKIKTDTLVNKKYNLKETDTVLLFVGRINILKNVLFIIDVLNNLKKKKIDFKMLFVGNGPDVSALKQKIEEYGLKNNVILCGEVKNRELLKSIYSRSKLFIFPSLYDASSLVQIEAASQKTPTIFLEGAITASTITNDVNGWIGPNNSEKFANKIIEILKNKQLYDNVVEKAYKDIYKTYKQMAKKIYKRYLYLIKKGGSYEKFEKK